MVDRTGKPVEEITGIAEERESSSAQIRTLFNEQRRTIIAECCEKVSHHEFQAARAEEERKILQEELWRQQQDFREVHQQNLTEMEELRKFQSSTFDTLTRQKFIEDQNTIMELSGRLQEMQNEVNCMNDSKDFQDAESVRSGNSHVTSRPVSFPPVCGGSLGGFTILALVVVLATPFLACSVMLLKGISPTAYLRVLLSRTSVSNGVVGSLFLWMLLLSEHATFWCSTQAPLTTLLPLLSRTSHLSGKCERFLSLQSIISLPQSGAPQHLAVVFFSVCSHSALSGALVVVLL